MGHLGQHLARPVTGTSAHPSPPRARRRLLGRATLAAIALAALAVAGVFAAARNLDAEFVKRRLVRLVRGEAGLDLDYADARVDPLSGVHLRQVTIASPEAVRGVAPLLLRAGTIDLGWSLLARGPTLQKLGAADVEVTIVVDERGRTSLDALAAGGATPSTSAPTPPGKRLGELLASLPDFGRVTLARAAVTIVRTRAGREVERLRLDGLGARATSRGRGARRTV